ncbi:aminoglycoside phosphotransferase family protein [Neptunomonas phycophila]|uniref:aminoglycoside phosphotransferase family protein n=1 Tax=Neptunomonas phycophila TaxID=1572645 RepID=UPI0035171168
MGQRLLQLEQWVTSLVASKKVPFGKGWVITPVSGDASFRRYFRLTNEDRSWILVDAPPEKEDSTSFVEVARTWLDSGIPVPEVIHVDFSQGFMLLEDFGDSLLFGELSTQSVEGLYTAAMDALLAIQHVGNDGLPQYDEPLLRREMSLFNEWFIGQLLKRQLCEKEQKMLDDLFAVLVASALEQPVVTVHRDFHSRNLMCLAEGRLGIIDFQDAVAGPITYDLVSLLKDCYVAWPSEQVVGWVSAYRIKAQQRGVLDKSVTDAAFLKWFDFMGLQRHIKVLGIFSRLDIRDGKAAYLEDIPRVLSYVLEGLHRYSEQYAECAAVERWLREQIVPSMKKLDCFKDVQL